MVRPPDGLEPRGDRVTIRLEPRELETLDTIRGAQTRSSFLRDLIARDAKRWKRSVAQKGTR